LIGYELLNIHNVRRIIGDNQNWACNAGKFGISLGAVFGWTELRHPGLATTITENRSRRRTQATTTWQQQTEGQPINIENVHQNYVCNMFKCDFNLRTTIHHRKI